jgi:hypothetical protein
MKNPTFHPIYQTDTTGQDFFGFRMNPTSPDHSDQMHRAHNPSVVGSILTGPARKLYQDVRAPFKNNWILRSCFRPGRERRNSGTLSK